ncbi:MAG: DNA cytosine methyltransferase [Oscillospiraceae bacterium]|nr:DNA cytosine methyltransferase [Oscillospiraceae bacterium]
MKGQTSFLDEIIVDSFAGGGGASTGIEIATGKVVTIAVNHDADAILMHRTNHPFTEHYQADVWEIDPVEVCRGRPVGMAWFSPDCKHFSKAKGSALVDRKIRGLAWIVLRWAALVKPRVIMLENVEEFQTWGPVKKGKPIKKKAGETFQQWLRQLRGLGYAIQYRELVAADYGAPTTRKRFVLIARCDGKPIVWPKLTHGKADSPEVKAGRLKPWRAAAEVIDWSLPLYSVFATKAEIKAKYGVNVVRPLAENTMRRVIRGVDKFTIRSGEPFIVPIGYGEREGQLPRVHDIREPLPTVVSVVKQNLCAAQLIQYHTEQTENVRANAVSEPLPTVDASNRYGLICCNLVEYYGNGNPLSLAEPMRTVTSHDRECLCAAHIAEFKGQDKGQAVDEPLRTITASAGEFGLVKTTIVKVADGADLGFWPEIREQLNRHCGYELKEDEILLLRIRGSWWFIADISLRMLAPRELYNAMGFPKDYIIDHDYLGNSYGKTKQVARCGNAVCPPMTEAVVRANLPEWCGDKIETMQELRQYFAG